MKITRIMILEVLLSFIFLAGCASGTPEISGEGTNATLMQDQKGFRASVVDFSVLLEWKMIKNSEGYLLEIVLGDGSSVPVALTPAEETSFLDLFVVPGTELTYRLSAIVSGKPVENREVTIKIPEFATSSMKVTLEMDQAPATFDSSFITGENFDPTSLDPSFFENLFPTDEAGEPIMDGSVPLDISGFVPQPIEATELVGPDGGEVSVTSNNGIMYTLTIPRDALRMEVPVRLRPVSNVVDVPLSGGAAAAVIVEPEGMVFDIPAILTITPPMNGSEPLTDGNLEFGIAFLSDGADFHLYPQLREDIRTSKVPHLAKLAELSPQAGPLAEIARLQIENGGGYGVGSGTAQEARKMLQKPPSTSGRRTSQLTALAQMDELTPLLPIEEPSPLSNLPPEAFSLAKIGESILQRSVKANDWSSFMETLEDFRIYMNSGGEKYNKGLNQKILDTLVQKSKNLLDKNKGECLTPDDFKAQDLVERLLNPKDTFSRLLSGLFQEKYGQKLLEDLAHGMKQCRFELDLDSKLTFGKSPDQLVVTNKFEKLPLQLTYSNGEIYLWGSTKMVLTTDVKGFCPAEIKQYDDLRFVVDKMTPVFGGQKLTDLILEKYRVFGWHQVKGASGSSGDDCPELIQIHGGGDYWTGLFTIARITLDGMSLSGWDKRGSSAITATWKSDDKPFRPYNAETVMTDKTLFTFRAIPTSRTGK